MQPRSPWKGKANPSFFCNHRSGRKLVIAIAFAERSKTDVFYRLIVINALLKPTSFTPPIRYLGITFVKILFHFRRSFQGMCLESLKETLLSIVSMYLLLKAHVNLYKQLRWDRKGINLTLNGIMNTWYYIVKPVEQKGSLFSVLPWLCYWLLLKSHPLERKADEDRFLSNSRLFIIFGLLFSVLRNKFLWISISYEMLYRNSQLFICFVVWT